MCGSAPRIDDAIGEAFDKTAKLLGLAYPGGPEVEREAQRGDPERFILPRPMLGRAEADFSLSGLKTALRVEAEKVAPLSDQDVADLCAAFQQAVVDVVTDRLRAGLRKFRERHRRADRAGRRGRRRGQPAAAPRARTASRPSRAPCWSRRRPSCAPTTAR